MPSVFFVRVMGSLLKRLLVTPLKYSVVKHGPRMKCRIFRRKALIIIIIACALLVILSIQVTTTGKFACKYIIPYENHYTLRLKPKAYNVPPFGKGDYEKLIDLNAFEFTKIHDCKQSSTFLLILITSAPHNFKKRHTIRTTWGQNDLKVKTLFMLGATSDPSLQKVIDNENDVHKDIVQGNFLDSYRNLTYKSVMALKYVVYHCTNVTYVLKTDDDIFVNTPLLKNYLTNDLSPFGAENFLQCHVWRNSPIYRRFWSKWQVTEEEFPGKHYPTYCSGPYVIFSPDALFKIYQGAQSSKYFYIEDVFLYGVAVGRYPEIHHTDSRPFALWMDRGSGVFKGSFDHTNFLFGPYELTVEEMLGFWNLVTSKPVPNSAYYYELV